MAYFLDFVTAGGKYLQMPSGSADVAAGQNFELEFELKRTNAANTRLLGKNGSSGGIRYPTTTTLGVINIANTGPTFTAPANFTEFIHYRVWRDDGANVNLSINGDTPQTGAQAGAFSFNRLCADIAGVSVSAQVRFVKLSKDGVLTNHWVNTTGTGTQMPDIVGGQPFNQIGTWPAGDSEWVFYEDGGGADTSLAAAGQAIAAGAAVLATAIMLAAGGTGVASGTANLTSAIRLQATGSAVATGTANLTAGGGSLSAAGQAVGSGSAQLTTQVRLQAAGSAVATGSAALSTQIRLVASGAAIATGTANLTAGSTSMSATGQAVPTGFANLTTSISLAASGAASPSSAGTLATGISLQASGQSVTAGFASLQTGSAELSATGQAYSSGYADLTTGISLSAAGYTLPSGYASMHTEIRLSAAGVAVASASADLGGERIPVIKRSVTINLERKSAAITIERRSFAYSPTRRSFKVTLNG